MAALPSGTVTFLFTDIEGSTTRWEHQPEAMGTALARHDVLLRAAIREHDGHVVKTMGDAFHAVFVRAPDAVAAALDAQRGLQAEPWGAIGPIRVRMAVHTGAAEERDGDYYGPPLNRAARLMGAGHGGQVLLSQSTYELVRDTPPDGANFVDLGEHRLKDLIRPERIFQLTGTGIPSDFPSLASLNVRPHNLPLQTTSLIGRDQEIQAVRSLLLRDDVRLVTLTGPGGTGKTRLSLQVAADLLDRYEDGVFFVELAPISEPALVVSTIAQALAVRDIVGRPLLDVLIDYLRRRQLVLVLDNFEQVLAAATVVDTLLRACPGLCVLVTSRAALQLRGEHEYAVPPLALPDSGHAFTPQALSQYGAVALFIERATAIKPDFTVTHTNAPAVAEICTRLDGLPLAIELAAARVRLLSPQAMLARLERRLALLTGGARDLPARQQTLRGTIAWSYDLLDESERRLFQRLSVFVGGCSLESAQAIGDLDGSLDLDMLDGVSSLVARSLLRQQDQPDGEPRFSLLETIREYALERLEDSGEAAAVRRRHAEHFLALAEEATPHLIRSESVVWLSRLQLEHDNLRAAFAWSLGAIDLIDTLTRVIGPLWRFWWTRGHFFEGRRWLEAALEHAADPTVRIKVLIGAASLALYQNDYSRSRALWSEVVTLGRACDDLVAVARALGRLGFIARNLGDYEQGLILTEESLALSRRLEDPEGLAWSLMSRGHVALGQGDYDRADACWEECQRVARKIDHVSFEAYALNQLAIVASLRGNFDRAMQLCEAALVLFRQHGDQWGELHCGQTMVRIARHGADEARVLALALSNLTGYLEVGNRAYASDAMSDLAWVARMRGDMAQAARLLGAAEAIFDSTGERRLRPNQNTYDAEVALLRDILGEDTFAAAWAEGKAMSLEQAAAYALEAPGSA